MALTQWEVIGPGTTPGVASPMPGVVVNGAAGTVTPTPTSGRGYPRS